MALVSLVVRFIYAAYCKRHFAECCFVWGFDRRLLYKMFVFSGWAFLGNGSFVLKEHGVNILLNIFCGPIGKCRSRNHVSGNGCDNLVCQ